MDDDRELLRALLRDDAGRPLEWPWPDVAPPHPAARRLLDALGVVGVPAVNAVVVARCESSGCARAPRAGMRFCRAHQPVSELRAERIGLDALARMDAGLPQAAPKPDTRPAMPSAELAPVREEPSVTPSNGSRWTRGSAIEAVQQFAKHHGRPPTSKEMGPRHGLPSMPLRKDIASSFVALLEMAGFQALGPGGKPRAVLVEREPEAGEERVAASPPDAEREADTSAAAGKGPVSPPELVLEAASRSTSTDGASDEGAKQEVPFEELLAEFCRALTIQRIALDEIEDVASRIRNHPDYEEMRNWLA